MQDFLVAGMGFATAGNILSSRSEGAIPMMTIVTVLTLKEGAEPQWDAAIRDRFEAARQRPGWIGGQLLMPLDGLNRRVIVGTWQTRGDWEAWHNDEAFMASRKRLEGLEAAPPEESWHEVLLAGDGRSGSTA